MTIEDKIKNKLKEIEEKENIRILFAVESGSRAWGFASPDSDYDVRFVYVRSEKDYLKLDTFKDVIEWQLDDVFDINGWDLQKALKLLHSSNPALFEWLYSPIIYKTSQEHEALKELSKEYFNTYKSANHYISMANRDYNAYLYKDIVSLKKYFYAIRPILAARWVLKNKSNPPVPFLELIEKELCEKDIKLETEKLLKQKYVISELGQSKKNELLNQFISQEIKHLKVQANNEKDTYRDWSQLNQFFLNIVKSS